MTADERGRALLLYCQESIARIEHYTAEGREAFFREPIIQDAVVRRLAHEAAHRPPAREWIIAPAGGKRLGSPATPTRMDDERHHPA